MPAILTRVPRLTAVPLTAATLLVLAVTTATEAAARARGAEIMALSASSNLHNLAARPLDALFVSAFWVETPWVFWPVAVLVALVLGSAERGLGTARAGLVFATAHVVATLGTVVGIAAGVALGWLPRALTFAVDVGPSYGLAGLAGVLALRAPTPRTPRACRRPARGAGGPPGRRTRLHRCRPPARRPCRPGAGDLLEAARRE